MSMSRCRALALAALLSWPIVCGAAKTNIVNTGSFFFSPAALVIPPGDTVRWTNSSLSSHDTTHQPTSGPRLWTNNMAKNTTFQFTFTNAGFYPYRCEQHASFNQTAAVSVVSVHLKSLIQFGNGNVEFSISGGLQGLRGAAERSSDLVNWTSFTTNTFPAGGSITVTDTTAPLTGQRFYRGRVLQP